MVPADSAVCLLYLGPMREALGQQLASDLRGCDRDRLDDRAFLERACVDAADAMGATVVAVHGHRYDPVGVSVVVILAESHLSLHTWPEHGIASIDVFVCNRANDPDAAKRHLVEALGASETSDVVLPRGRIGADGIGE